MEVMVKIACLLFFGFVHSSVLPVEKCTVTDKACMVSAVQKMVPYFIQGMPEHNVDVLDPMTTKKLLIDVAGLQFNITDGLVRGLKGAIIDDITWKSKQKIFKVDFHADLSLRGDYTAGGRVLVLPITGDGHAKAKMKHVNIDVTFYYDLVKKDGKDHVKVTKYTFKFEVIELASIHLTNLFHGNKELSNAMLSFMNNNWRELVPIFCYPLYDAIVHQIYKNIQHFFDEFPIGEIANI